MTSRGALYIRGSAKFCMFCKNMQDHLSIFKCSNISVLLPTAMETGGNQKIDDRQTNKRWFIEIAFATSGV